MLLTASSPPRLAITSLRSTLFMGSSFAAASIETMQAGRIVDQNLLQQALVVIDITIEQLDRLGIVHHAGLAPVHMRPVGSPDHSIRRRGDEHPAERDGVVEAALHPRIAVAVRQHHPP